MQFYRQTSDYTGAAAALLTALNHLQPEKFSLEKEQEFLIWKDSALLPTRGSSIFGLAAYAKRAGISVTVVVEEEEYHYPDYRFKRYKKTEIEDATFMSDIHKKQAKDLGVVIENKDFTLADVQALLTEDNIVLLRLNVGVLREQRPTSKYVVLFAYEDGHYLLIDPAQGELRIEEQTLQDAFDTLTTKKRRDHRMLVLR